MRDQPVPNADPYRTLGLEPGASMAEVKRAYRLLAKAFHPDSAGETAVPRFLAIHAAYEQLKSGKPAPMPRTPRTTPAEPWRADPTRARAARERARTARTGPTGSTGATGRPGRSGPTAGRAERSGTSGTSGKAASGTSASSSGARGSGRRRDVRKATMGSTSYDEARDPSDATWSGASWYGPSSGEYWIVNPREYADPRKHGPEYQQRARRPVDGDPPEGGGAFSTADARSGATTGARTGATTGATASATGGTEAAWRTRAGAAVATESRPQDSPPEHDEARATGWTRPRSEPREAARDLDRNDAFATSSRAWLGGPADDPIRRLGIALVAWPPIGLAAATAIGEVTGCTAYAAACSGAEPLLPWLAQAPILGLLLLIPPLARLLAGGAVAVLIALLPITAFLIAVGAGGAPEAGPALAVLLAVAWLTGVAWAARTVARPFGLEGGR